MIEGCLTSAFGEDGILLLTTFVLLKQAFQSLQLLEILIILNQKAFFTFRATIPVRNVISFSGGKLKMKNLVLGIFFHYEKSKLLTPIFY